jgi:probable addiction module antidote protein
VTHTELVGHELPFRNVCVTLNLSPGRGVLARLEGKTDMKASRNHDDAMIDMLQRDPEFAATYLRTALEEISIPGGEAAFLAALRQVAQARGGITQLAKNAHMKREAVSRALSTRGNPTLKTLATLYRALLPDAGDKDAA